MNGLAILAALVCLHPGETPSVRGRVQVSDVGGWVGERMAACYEKAVKGTDVREIVDIYKTRDAERDWKTEFWGKWMHSAPVLAAYYGDAAFQRRIAAAADEVVATQTPDGYIGNYPSARQCPTDGDGWDVWGRKYTLLGLLHQYDATHDRKLLDAGLRMVDHLATQAGPGKKDLYRIGNYRGMPSLSILEPVMWLYNRTGEKRCLDFAAYIVDRMEQGAGLLSKCNVDVAVRFPKPKKHWHWENGAKAYEMMSCYQGLIEYARATGRRDIVDAAVAAGENIFTNEITVCGSGASYECWHYGRRKQTEDAGDRQEGCVTVTWMRLCEALWRETGDAKWADRFERAFYNAYLGCMSPDGSFFAKYTPLEGVRTRGDPQCGLKANCCTANGPRGFVEFLNFMAAAQGDVLTLNLYAPAKVGFDLACGSGALKVDTAWPERDEVRLTLLADRPLRFTVRLRLPGEGRYREIVRDWQPGQTHVEKLPLVQRTVEQDGFRAYLRGPVVFAQDRRAEGGQADFARQTLAVRLTTDENEVRLADYASAGNTWDDKSRFRVWIREP